jgi:hypothetical protein
MAGVTWIISLGVGIRNICEHLFKFQMALGILEIIYMYQPFILLNAQHRTDLMGSAPRGIAKTPLQYY